MSMVFAVGLGVIAGWLAWKFLKVARPMQEMMLLGATGGVFCGFALELMATGSRWLNNATVNSIVAAAFGAILFILLRRLLVEWR